MGGMGEILSPYFLKEKRMKLRDIYKARKGYNSKTSHTVKDIERYTEGIALYFEKQERQAV